MGTCYTFVVARYFLVVTASQALYDQVKNAFLPEAGFHIFQTNHLEEITNLAEQINFDVAILDTGLHNAVFRELVDNLKSRTPALRWLVLPPEEEGEVLPFLGFKPDGYLTRPFDSGELVEQVENLFVSELADASDEDALSNAFLFEVPPPDPDSRAIKVGLPREEVSTALVSKSSIPKASKTASKDNRWDADPERNRQIVDNLLVITGVQAAMILKNDMILGFKSKLPARAKPELIGWLHHSDVFDDLREMVSYLKLESTDKDHLVYVVPLGMDTVLTTVFESTTPFKEARTLVALFLRTQPEYASNLEKTPVKERSQLTDQEYTIVLAPRSMHHLLMGKTAINLSEWIHQVALIHNWQLKKLDVQPGYVTWVTRFAAGMPPEEQVKIIRHYTSIRLKSVFASNSEHLDEHDFWADEYLMLQTSEPHVSQVVQDFIRRIAERDETEF
jgi:DNA-binding NarL/FixJ family response regulator/REP element-mobilizing transposase RayT